MRRLVRGEGARAHFWEARVRGTAVLVREGTAASASSQRLEHATLAAALDAFDALLAQRSADGYVATETAPSPALAPAAPAHFKDTPRAAARRLGARFAAVDAAEMVAAREAAAGSAVGLVVEPRGLRRAVFADASGPPRALPVPNGAYVALDIDADGARVLVASAQRCVVCALPTGPARTYPLDVLAGVRAVAFAPGERVVLFDGRDLLLARLGADATLAPLARWRSALEDATQFAATRDGRVVALGGLGPREPEVELVGVYGDRLEPLGRVVCDGRDVVAPEVWAAGDTLCVSSAGGVQEFVALDVGYDPTLRAPPPSPGGVLRDPGSTVAPTELRRAAAVAALGPAAGARYHPDAALVAVEDDRWPEDHPLRRYVTLRARAAGLSLGHALELLAMAPVRALPVRGLDLRACHVGARGLAELAAHEALAALDALDASDARIADAGLEALLRSGYAINLRALTLADNPLSAAAVVALADGDWLQRLEQLSLRGLALDATAVLALATSATLTRLRALDLARCGLGPDDLAALRGSVNLAGCERLGLADNPLGPAAGAAFGAPAATLDELDLAGCSLGDAGVVALACGAPFARLRRLSLARNALGARALAALAGSARFPVLERLDLAGNGLAPSALASLRECAALPRLQHLALD